MTNKAVYFKVLSRASVAVALAGGLVSARPAQAQLTNALTGTAATADDTIMGGFDVDLTLSDSSGLNTVGENYRNELSMYLEPRFALGKRLFKESKVWSKLSLSGRFVLTRGLTGTSEEGFGSNVNAGPLVPCSSPTPSAEGGLIDPNQVARCHPAANSRRFDYSDIWLNLGLPRFAKIPAANIDVSTSLRFVIPTSAESQFATLRFATSASLGFSKAFLHDKLRVGYNFGASKNFHGYSTAGINRDQNGGAAEQGGNSASPISGTGLSNFYADPTRAATGTFATSYSFSNGLSAHYTVNSKWDADLLYLWTDGFTYPHHCDYSLPAIDVNTCTTGAEVAGNSGTSITAIGHRRAQVLWATVNYSFRPWMQLSLAWVNWAPREKPDSSYRQPFYSTDYNAFSSVILSVSTSIEEVAKRWRKSSPPVLTAKR
jgi:hypothetical protein